MTKPSTADIPPQDVKSTKTTTLKVIGNDVKLRLFSLFDPFTLICSDIKDKIYQLKDDESTVKIYNDYVDEGKRGRAAATTVFTKIKEKKTPYVKNSFTGKYKSNPIFPIYKCPKKGLNFATAGWHYTSNAAIHTQLDSLNKCDKICNDEFNKLKKEVEDYDETLHEDYDEQLVADFYEFIQDTMLSGWSFDGNFQKFFVQVMLPGLKNGTIITKGTYRLGDKKKRYSFYTPKLAESIASNSKFWDLMANDTTVSYFNANHLLQQKKEHAAYSKTTLVKAQVRPVFANNGVKFSISCDGRMAYMAFKLPAVDGNPSELLNVPCAYQKFYFGGDKAGTPRNSYLSGLTIEDNKDGTYICHYSVNNKRPQTAQLNECFLRMVVKNKNWVQKYLDGTLTKKDGPINASYFEFYFDLCMGVVEAPIHDLTNNEVFKKGGIRGGIRAFHSSAYPERKDFDNQSSIPVQFRCVVDKPYRLMGVDLGQRNPFAYCIKNNDGSVVASGHMVGASNDNYKKYIEFGNECEYIIQLIKETKNYLYGDDDAIDADNYARVKSTLPFKSYLLYLTSKRGLVNVEDQSKGQTHLLRADDGWMIKDLVYKQTKQYHILNDGRYTDNDWRQTLYWADAISRFIDLQKTYNNFGSYYDHAKKTKVNGTGKGFCSTYYDHINNLNKDTFKKFCFELLPIIKKYGVSLVCVEKLTSMYGDKLRSADDNRMYNMWPVGQLKTFLKGVLAPYKVGVIQVSEQDTSQIVDGKWAYRPKDGNAANNLYYLDVANKIQSVHSDEQAAFNIVDRALTNHTNLYSLYMVNVLDSYWVPNQTWNPKEIGGKLSRGFLTKLYGTSNVVFIKQYNKLIRTTIGIKELKKMVGKSKPLGKGYMYRVNETEWIDGESKQKLVDSICERLGDTSSMLTSSQVTTSTKSVVCVEIGPPNKNSTVKSCEG